MVMGERARTDWTFKDLIDPHLGKLPSNTLVQLFRVLDFGGHALHEVYCHPRQHHGSSYSDNRCMRRTMKVKAIVLLREGFRERLVHL